MSFGDKVIDLFMPTKKESRQNSEPAVNKQKPEVEDFTKLIDRDSLHSLFPFSWEQYPTYVQSGENFIRVLAIADYPKRVYGNWLSELKRKKALSILCNISTAPVTIQWLPITRRRFKIRKRRS